MTKQLSVRDKAKKARNNIIKIKKDYNIKSEEIIETIEILEEINMDVSKVLILLK